MGKLIPLLNAKPVEHADRGTSVWPPLETRLSEGKVDVGDDEGQIEDRREYEKVKDREFGRHLLVFYNF